MEGTAGLQCGRRARQGERSRREVQGMRERDEKAAGKDWSRSRFGKEEHRSVWSTLGPRYLLAIRVEWEGDC